MARKTPSFVTLEKAFWTYVDQHCPFPLQSRHRYSWVRENLRFEHDGIIYERASALIRPDAPGPASCLISYTGSDGSVVEEWQGRASITGAVSRAA